MGRQVNSAIALVLWLRRCDGCTWEYFESDCQCGWCLQRVEWARFDNLQLMSFQWGASRWGASQWTSPGFPELVQWSRWRRTAVDGQMRMLWLRMLGLRMLKMLRARLAACWNQCTQCRWPYSMRPLDDCWTIAGRFAASTGEAPFGGETRCWSAHTVGESWKRWRYAWWSGFQWKFSQKFKSSTWQCKQSVEVASWSR